MFIMKCFSSEMRVAALRLTARHGCVELFREIERMLRVGGMTAYLHKKRRVPFRVPSDVLLAALSSGSYAMVQAVLEATPGLAEDERLSEVVRWHVTEGDEQLADEVSHGLMQHHSAAMFKMMRGIVPGLRVEHLATLARFAPPHVAAVLQSVHFAALKDALVADGITEPPK